MSTDDRPFNYRIVWEDKPALHASIVPTVRRSARRPGQTLEIGGGSGNLKNFRASRGID